MKRCIICGNVGEDSSTKCDVCGNPFINTTPAQERQEAVQTEPEGEAQEAVTDRPEVTDPVHGHEEQALAQDADVQEMQEMQDGGYEASGYEAQEADMQGAQEAGYEVQTSAQEDVQGMREAASQPGQRRAAVNRPQRRMRSGPQIYGQEEGSVNPQEYAAQGMVRRNVQGRPGSAPAPQMMGQQAGQPGQGQPNRPVNRPQGSANQPNRPMYQGQRPMQPGQAPQMAGQPMRQGNPAMMGQAMGARSAMPAGNYQSRQLTETARQMLQSPMFLLIAILNTVYFIGAIGAIILKQMNYSQVIRLIEGFDLPSQISGYVGSLTSLLSMLDAGALIANFALHIPELLFVIGLWLIFITAKKNGERMSGAGFTLVKTTIIINMVVACFVMAAVLIITVAVVIASWVSGTTAVIIGAVAALIVVIAVVMLVIMYYFCYLATIKTCRLNSDAGESYGRVSGYVAVIHIILALIAIIDLLSGIVNSEVINIVGAVGKIGWMALFAAWIFMYRGKMEEFED